MMLIGVMAEKPIFKSLSAKAGLFYTMKGTKGKNGGSGFLQVGMLKKRLLIH